MPLQSRPVSCPDLGSCDALLVLPPFAGIDRPSLGLHILQACAERRGFKVSVLYANLLLAAELGVDLYEAICYAPTAELLGERIFSRAAGFAPAVDRPASDLVKRDALTGFDTGIDELAGYVGDWSSRLADALAAADCPIVGVNTTFEQTASAVAILRRVKQRTDKTTIIGGANCEGEMGLGIAQLSAAIDHVFSGESEETFVEFLEQTLHGHAPPPRIIAGRPCEKLDELPVVDYSEYYRQLDRTAKLGAIPATKQPWLAYEGSRGCWWGQKHHCTFCGINGQGMSFRQKRPEKVLSELEALMQHHPSRKVLMVDNIMPTSFFDKLLPALSGFDPRLHVFYEQKSNLTLAKIEALEAAGVAIIQPGIEALSSSLLSRMKKGVKAHQNLALLRYARACDLSVNWNLLYAFPGDHEADYQETLKIIELIPHLHPPTGMSHLSIDRFSPYFDRPLDFEITNLQPMEAYAATFPGDIDLRQIAYHFVGEYDCSHRRSPDLTRMLEEAVEDWRRSWMSPGQAQPTLAIEQLDHSLFLLVDTRRGMRLSFMTAEQARIALSPVSRSDASVELIRWALDEAQVAIELDGLIVPLATARPKLIKAMDRRDAMPSAA